MDDLFMDHGILIKNKCYYANFIISEDVWYGGVNLELDQACMNQ